MRSSTRTLACFTVIFWSAAPNEALAQCSEFDTQTLIGADSTSDDEFGTAVAVYGDTLVIGAHGDNEFGNNSGSVYVFEFDADRNLWVEQGKVYASDGQADDWFGASVALSESTMAVNAQRDEGGRRQTHLTYIFERRDDRWVETQLIAFPEAADAVLSRNHMNPVVIEKDLMAIGSWVANDVFGVVGSTAKIQQGLSGFKKPR